MRSLNCQQLNDLGFKIVDSERRLSAWLEEETLGLPPRRPMMEHRLCPPTLHSSW
jgi:hypothetical protein